MEGHFLAEIAVTGRHQRPAEEGKMSVSLSIEALTIEE